MEPNDSHAVGEAALLKELVAGEPKALERLYDRHSGALYALALRIAATPERAERAVEAAFSDLWSLRQKLMSSGRSIPPALWLMSRCRARALETQVSEAAAPAWALPDLVAHRIDELLALDQDTRRVHVDRLLATLAPAQRAVVEKAFFEGSSLSRIAADQARPLAEVASDLKRGLATLVQGSKALAREGNAR